MRLSSIENPEGGVIYYTGSQTTLQPPPALIYLAFSGEASLLFEPINQPAVILAQEGFRTFSWDLPFHEKDVDPKEAMFKWAHEIIQNPNSIGEYIERCRSNLNFLVEANLIDPSHVAIAGLSRGGFIAAHFAALEDRLQTILGFSPLTQPKPVEEFSHLPKTAYEYLSLTKQVDKLIGKRVRLYIGNCDTRVGTDACFEFINTLTQAGVERGLKYPQVEMIIYPSVGHRGHGTPPGIFHDGANWLIQVLGNKI